MGKAKLAPRPDQTIPRLELSAAVFAVDLADLISNEVDIELDNTTFYTDSKVVLGYIYNETRRFYVYVWALTFCFRIRTLLMIPSTFLSPTPMQKSDHSYARSKLPANLALTGFQNFLPGNLSLAHLLSFCIFVTISVYSQASPISVTAGTTAKQDSL